MGQEVINLVLFRYTDAACKVLDTGEGVQQSWLQLPLTNSICYDVNVGMHCQFRCNVKLTCEYATGSGIMLEEYGDTTCSGSPTSSVALARHLTWLGAVSWFQGACTPDGNGMYMKFNKPVTSYPDCKAQGAVDVGEGADVAYEARYFLQFYSDASCTSEFQVNEFSSFQYNRFQWRVYRGSQHCLDYVDASTRPSNWTAAVINPNVMNFKLMCGNMDGLGNGILVRRHNGNICSGTSADAEYWRDVFYPMNLYLVQDFFNGECVEWGSMFVKFDKPWNTMHYPDCSQFACKSGYCSGGRLQQPYTGATPYMGEIRTPVARAQVLPSHGLHQAAVGWWIFIGIVVHLGLGAAAW
ncbi:unnamed protein product [Symbiodinium natans]|uniref:Uncharacterized protein n=1 Tax=Symbiodinium natans TaxID=878477 RepID=A0A812S3Z1_9DINO|nr:unnamed protein product [Symbiodinium natans]